MTVVFAGSFNPLTNGHLDIIKRSTKMYDKVVIVVTLNQKKKQINLKKIQNLIEKTIIDNNLDNIYVDVWDGLIVDYMQKYKFNYLLRSLRNCNDFNYECDMQSYNKGLNNSIEIIYLIANPKYMHLSSSGVLEICKYDITKVKDLVPKPIYEYLKEEYENI